MPRAFSLPRLAVLTSLSVAVAGLAVAAPAIAAGPAKTAKVHAVAPSERHAALSRIDAAGAALGGALAAPTTAVAAAAATTALAAKTSTAMRTAAITGAVPVPSGISVVGATWTEGSMPAGARLLVRTASKGVWSQWQALDSDDGHDPDPGTAEAAHERGGTQPYVVTDASAVQVRLDTTTGTAPASASVDVVDPGTSSADATVGTSSPGSAAAAATQPTIYSRAQWGADESLRHGELLYGSIQAAFVHHTVSQNNYSASQVPAILRGIYAFHVNGRGWNDIGYNFLVDRFGRIWEGRYGGIARPVVGAHTRDYNSNSFAMSAIGNFDVAHVPSAIIAAYQRLFAWKLSLHGIPAYGTVVLNGHRINRISGHRDVGQTACPGRYLYALLPSIRSGTSSRQGTLPRPVLSRSLDGNTTPDLLARTPGGGNTIFLPDLTSPVAARTTIGTSGWDKLDLDTLSPDLTGDGRADLVAREKATGRIRVYPGDGHGRVTAPSVHGSGWGVIRRLLAPGDLDGDHQADLLGVKSTGQLLFYKGNGAGWVAPPVVVGASGWTAFSQMAAVGDSDGDGRADLVAVRASTGQQVFYPGLGTGRFAGPRQIGTGWSVTNLLVGAGDLDGNGTRDLVAREAGTGKMRTYAGDGHGDYSSRLIWGAGWQALSTVTGGSDLTGDGRPDLVGVSGGQLLLYPGSGQKEYGTGVDSPIDLSGTDHAFVVGDVNRNGKSDVIGRRTATGELVLWDDAGYSTANAAPRVISAGFGAMNLLAPAGDLTMDGIPDLLARTPAGNLYLYPLTSTGAVKPGVLIASGMSGMTDIIGVGPNDVGAAPDVVARVGTGGNLLLYPGNGVGQLLTPRVIRSSTADVARLVGSGDVDGDGRSDVVIQLTDGSLALWAGPGGSGGLATSRPLVTSNKAVGHELS